MEKFEKKQEMPVVTDVVEFAEPQEESETNPSKLLMIVLHRWYVVLLTFLIVSGIGILFSYLLLGKKYETEGMIHISTVDTPIMYVTEDRLPPYDIFKNTQATLIRQDVVLNRAADELKNKDLALFFLNDQPFGALKKMVNSGTIKIEPDRRTEFIHIKMLTENPRDAEQVIDAIIRGYMSIIVSEGTKGEDMRLTALEKRKRILETQMEQQRLKIRQRVQEYGEKDLTSRQKTMLETVATLQKELIAVSIKRIMLETQVAMKEKQTGNHLAVNDLADQRQKLIERDPIVQSLLNDVNRYEDLVREGQTTMRETNPEMKRRMDNLENLKRQLQKRSNEIASDVENRLQQEIEKSRTGDLDNSKAALEQAITYEQRLQEKLEKTDAETIGLGRKQFEIDDYSEQYDQLKQVYNDVCRRIEELNIESSRQSRISVGSYASSIEATGKRRKFAMASLLGGLAMGLFLAIVMDKLDKRLKEPTESARRIGVRIIGTTTCPHNVDKKMLLQQLVDDYQTICTNISFLNDSGDTKVIVVTSPGMADGKTTFSVNLATSFVRSGHKTLLIDGDLRKPDVANLLNVPAERRRGLQNYFFDADIQKAAYKLDSMDFYVLAADDRNSGDAFTLLSHPEMYYRIKLLRNHYDVIIIDTPPVLAFSDALVWARMSDGVILTSFIGHTSRVEMQEAVNRLNEVNVRILGTVVNNVKVSDNYRRYGYGYGYDYGKVSQKKQEARRKRDANALLLSENAGPMGDPSNTEV